MKKINQMDSIIQPIITEKATVLSEFNKTVFKVKVIKINIINLKSKKKFKQGRISTKSGYKKAIVTLKKGQSIDLTTGI